MNQPKRILVVEDDDASRKLAKAMVESLGHEADSARDGLEALAKLKLDFDLVLLDVQLPAMDGYEIARRIRSDPRFSDLPIVMVTSLESREDRLRATEAGANDFIAKPIDKTELRIRANSLLKMKEAQDALKRQQMVLEETVARRTATLRQTLEEMVEAQRTTHQAHLETIHRLALASEYKDKVTATHIARMSHYSALLARGLNLPPGEVEIVLNASPLHDVGKIGIPDAILLKPGKLDADEWVIMKQHTIIGHRILSDSTSPLLQAGGIIALSHHEKWDGSGYPNGIAGEDIPLYGRIIAVADAFDALTTERQYKKAFSNEKSYEILREGRGAHFDPKIIDLFFNLLDEITRIQKQHGS
jgi:putative two-component system response regulator